MKSQHNRSALGTNSFSILGPVGPSHGPYICVTERIDHSFGLYLPHQGLIGSNRHHSFWARSRLASLTSTLQVRLCSPCMAGRMLWEIILEKLCCPHYERILCATESHMVSQKRHHLLIRRSALERPRIICCNPVRDMRSGGGNMAIFGIFIVMACLD